MHRNVKKVGGSLHVLIPHDVAEMMGVVEGSPVSLTLAGRQLIIEPEKRPVAKGVATGRTATKRRGDDR